MATYAYRTRDYGRTWQALITPATAGVRGYAHVIKEDPKSPNILFVGTEFGLYVSLDAGATWSPFAPNNFPSVAVRDLAFQTRDDDLVLATHGRGIWIIDDISPLRELSRNVVASDAALIAGRPGQQRIQGSGGYGNGDAAYNGQNPADGVVINYYQKSRQVIGRITIEVLDAQGRVQTTIPASNRKGLNRVVWSMRDDPPQTPRGATLVFQAAQGPRVPPGTYTARLTKGKNTYTMPFTVALDRRATFTIADKEAQYAAAERVSALFGRMSVLNDKIVDVSTQAQQRSAGLPPSDALRTKLDALANDATGLRKKIVATTEGGAITGEERLREHMGYVYGAILSVENRPTPYQMARVDALERELGDVELSFGTLTTTQLADVNRDLKARNLPEIIAHMPQPVQSGGGGAPTKEIAKHLVGLHLFGAGVVQKDKHDAHD